MMTVQGEHRNWLMTSRAGSLAKVHEDEDRKLEVESRLTSVWSQTRALLTALLTGFWMFLTWMILRRQTRAVEVRKVLGEGAASLRSLRTARSAKEKLPRTGSASASPSQLRKEHL